MEHQTITSMGGFGDMLIAHELAHMWFGDKITCKDWHHIWLNEGFATYGECVMNEAWYGKAGYDSYIANKIANAKMLLGQYGFRISAVLIKYLTATELIPKEVLFCIC